jgi:soluble lytic murein transglycosylase-like protein
MSMDFDTGIMRIQARIDQIFGVDPQDQPTTPTISNVPSGRFASMVQQQMAGQEGGAGKPQATPAIEQLVQSNSASQGVDPDLIRAVMANESAFDQNATSSAGAQGLMQLMPQTAADVGVTNSYDPSQNVAGGTKYLRTLLDRFGGNLTNAVAAYNAGPEAVDKYNGVPPYPETQSYVKNVLDTYKQYKTGQ